MAPELATAPPELKPATNLDEVWEIFDPNLEIDPSSHFYVPREDHHLQRLTFDLKKAQRPLHAFLCGHSGSGKTTELKRLRSDPELLERYVPVYATAMEMGTDTVQLTHDALLLEIGLALVKVAEAHGLKKGFQEELDRWTQEVVKTLRTTRGAEWEAGSKASAWIASFRAGLQSRKSWTQEQREILEPKIQDLTGILNRIAQDLANKSGREVLVIVDDLEKGESKAERDMHQRLFQEQYDVLVQPRFSVVYTLPIYYRALPENRIPKDLIYTFSASRLYDRADKEKSDKQLREQGLDSLLPGVLDMRSFVDRRIANPSDLLDEETREELIRIGGGLFRETAWAFRDAARFALLRGASRIDREDAESVFHRIKKDYQPSIRGEAIGILKAVLKSREGWVPGVEPFLQSRAVMEYENGDLWLDVRYVLKSYVRGLELDGG